MVTINTTKIAAWRHIAFFAVAGLLALIGYSHAYAVKIPHVEWVDRAIPIVTLLYVIAKRTEKTTTHKYFMENWTTFYVKFLIFMDTTVAVLSVVAMMGMYVPLPNDSLLDAHTAYWPSFIGFIVLTILSRLVESQLIAMDRRLERMAQALYAPAEAR